MKPRAKTAEEIREEFLNHIRYIAQYWAELPDKTPKEKCDGVAFSILNIFDGGSTLPAFDIVARPHPEDKAYCIENNEDWYEAGTVINDCSLHEMY